MPQNQYFDQQDVKGYYLLAHPQFMRLITAEDKDKLELKLVVLTLAGSMLRQRNPLPTQVQTEHLYNFLRFLIHDYGQLETLRPAASHYYAAHPNNDGVELALISQYEEFASMCFHEIIGSDPVPRYSGCMLVGESPSVQLKHYRALLWHMLLDRPELMEICSDNYALEMLINLTHVREVDNET